MILSLVACASACPAQNREGTFTLTIPFLGWYQRDHSIAHDSDYTWGVGAGLNFTDNLGTEITFNRLDSDDTDIFVYKLDILFHLTELDIPGNLVPFVAAGIGDTKYNTKTDKKDDLFLNIGPGLKYFLTNSIALRGDLRYVLEFRGSDRYNNFLFLTGLMFQFGGEKASRPEPAVSEPESLPPVQE
jgi:OOP family OmpA-OmpF porin